MSERAREGRLESVISRVREACYYPSRLGPMEGRTPVFMLSATTILDIVGPDPRDERINEHSVQARERKRLGEP